MPTRAFRIAYDGSGYRGFQRQPDVPTVEDALLGALRALEVPFEDGTPPGYAAAGRTDAGVSALAQTVALEAPDWLSPAALNGELPDDVRAWAHADVPDGFHATHDAAARTYAYHLHAPDADLGRAREAAGRFVGEHDVHNLTPDDSGTVRRVEAVEVERDGPSLVVVVRAPGFSRQQVRRTVTVLREVAEGRASPGHVGRVLGEEPLTGPEGIPPAPAYPLALLDVAYPGVEFAVEPAAAASARETFDSRRVEHRTRARVAGWLADGTGHGDPRERPPRRERDDPRG